MTDSTTSSSRSLQRLTARVGSAAGAHRCATATAFWVLGLATPAAAQSAEASSVATANPNLPLFVLVAALCVFGYMIFSNTRLNSRLDRLERSLRPTASGDDPLALNALSWDRVLHHLEAAPPFLGRDLTVTQPGLYLLGVCHQALVPALAANVVVQLLGADDEAAVLVALQSMGPDELGARLLTIEAGTPWASLDEAEQDRVLRRVQSRLRKYENQILLVGGLDWSPEALLKQARDLQARSGQALAAIILEGTPALPDTASSTAFIERLRRVGQLCGLPVFLLMTSRDNPVWAAWETTAAEQFQAILEVDRASDGEAALNVRYGKYPGTPPAVHLELNADTGRIIQV